MKPLLRRSDLAGPHFYIVTRYTVKDGFITAQTKHEVTAEELAALGLEVLPLAEARPALPIEPPWEELNDD